MGWARMAAIVRHDVGPAAGAGRGGVSAGLPKHGRLWWSRAALSARVLERRAH